MTLSRTLQQVSWAIVVTAVVSVSSTAGAQDAEWTFLLKKIAAGQDASAIYRDRSMYEIKLTVTRFKLPKDDWKEEIVSSRTTTAAVAPNAEGEVITTVLTDTDDKGKPRKVNPKDKSILGTASFLDAIFFPFYPEKILKYEITGIERYKEDNQDAIAVGFVPKLGTADAPLIEGTGYFLESTGEILKLEVQTLVHFEIIDKELRKLERFRATVEYTAVEPGIRLPLRAWGQGYGKLKQLKDDFRFNYSELGHRRSPHYRDHE